ncbi:MAG: response regulator, partial [Abitibacteriaceae bacterium]|nr:response regulator [Abditibacteriaceae bacterium]
TVTLKKDDASGVPGGTAYSYAIQHNGEPNAAHLEEDEAQQTAVPLTLGDHIIGTLRLHLPEDLDSRTERLLLMLCEHAVLAIDRTRRFEQLQRAKREWELTFDGMVDGVYICVDGVIIRANRALADMLGLKITRILGQTREDLHARLPEYQVLRPWERADHGPEDLDLQTTEFRFGIPERVFVEASFAPRSASSISWRQGSVSSADGGSEAARRVCIVREVTEQRHLQEQLVQSEKLAALGELVSGVAHELNNPLTTVVGYAQLLEEDTGMPAHVQRRINMIHQESVRASRIVQNLLAFARRSEPQKAQLDINEVIGTILRMRAYQLQADNIEVVTEYGDNLPAVWGDPFQLQQVFLNIINNGAQAIQQWRSEGTIRISTTVAPAHFNGLDGIRITITDNGPGITAEHLRRVFDPFFTTKPTGQGTGLGMSISLGIISNHNGRIWAESRLGHGASFIVELPAAQEGENPAPTQEPASEATTVSTLGSHILVVDDEEPVVTLITEILMQDGHEVTPAFNGAEALALLQIQDFDLIISDVRMPAVGGPTFFEILQTTRPDLLPRVVFVTGDTVSKSTQTFLQKAARPVLSKPFDPERLRALVAENLHAQG